MTRIRYEESQELSLPLGKNKPSPCRHYHCLWSIAGNSGLDWS